MSSSALRSSYLRPIVRPLSFLVLALICAAPSFADSHARIVRLSYIDGDVELDKGDGRGFNTAYMNMPLIHQSKLWARDGQAEVEFEDGSSVRLTPDTILAFSDLSLGSDGQRDTSIELVQGTAYFDIHRRESDSFEVQFGHQRVQLLKSAHFRVDGDKREFELAVMSGEVQVSSTAGSDVAVKKGETIRIDSDDPDRYQLAKNIDVESYDGWDNERAKGHDQVVSSAAVSGRNSDLTYGLSDLNASGNYFYVPGYGYMWRPASASLAWDPFADGYWVSYPGFGYTFVSSYPWGWAPYRYGSWQFVNGYGWCWNPGSNWNNNWHTVPPVRNVPPHFRPPVAPRRGPGEVIVVDHGTASPLPPRRIVVDNDSLDHRRPHSTKVATDTGEVIRQGQSVAPAPATGFVSTTAPSTSTVPASIPVSTPGIVTVGPSRQVTPHMGGRRFDDGKDESRDTVLNQRQIAPAAIVVAPANSSPAPVRTMAPIAPAPAPTHSDIHTAPPRMEPRISPPPMRMETRPMGASPSMGASRSMGPSMPSGGGVRMSSPSMGGGNTGGGGRSTGSAASGRQR